MIEKFADYSVEDFEEEALLKLFLSGGVTENETYFNRGNNHHIFLVKDGEKYTTLHIEEVYGESGREDWAAADDFHYEDEVIGEDSTLDGGVETFKNYAEELLETLGVEGEYNEDYQRFILEAKELQESGD